MFGENTFLKWQVTFPGVDTMPADAQAPTGTMHQQLSYIANTMASDDFISLEEN